MSIFGEKPKKCQKGPVQRHYDLTVLFVCLGNTCRSPMAEAILRSMVQKYKLNWFVDSAGLRNWHNDELPNKRTLQTLKENGLGSNHVGRAITVEDFYFFDHILSMDYINYCELQAIATNLSPTAKCKIERLGSYLPKTSIDDPEEVTEAGKPKDTGKSGETKNANVEKRTSKKSIKSAVLNVKDDGEEGDTFESPSVEGQVSDPRDIPDPYFIRKDEIFREMYAKIYLCVQLFLQAKCSTCGEEGVMVLE